MEQEDKDAPAKKRRGWDEFTCPECDAHNPYGCGFEVREEVFCAYCGCVFEVRRDPNDDSRFRLRRP